jgi:hypothetical protein
MLDHFRKNSLSIYLCLSLTISVASVIGQVPAHATVNVIMGNRNGLVVVTDSKLSSGKQSMGFAPKIFQVDSRTVCSIAGAYRVPGPKSGRSYPVAIAIPSIMQQLSSTIATQNDLDIDQKMTMASEYFKFGLGIVAEADAASHIPVDNSESVLTLAGYDKGLLEIRQMHLAPRRSKSGEWTYQETSRYAKTVDDEITYKLAGFENPGESILEGKSTNYDTDPTISLYRQAHSRDNGASLTVNDLKLIAKRIEAITAAVNPLYVGVVAK